jgi:rhodanese-related sulfurtransferase
MPYSEFNSRLGEILKDRDKEIILYVFSGGTDVFAAANTLKDNGFTKVSVLMGGIFNLRWTAANRKGASDIKKWVVDVPEANW